MGIHDQELTMKKITGLLLALMFLLGSTFATFAEGGKVQEQHDGDNGQGTVVQVKNN
jgi:hypothetical protein